MVNIFRDMHRFIETVTQFGEEPTRSARLHKYGANMVHSEKLPPER